MVNGIKSFLTQRILRDNVPHFVEIDRMQHMKANEHKIQLYGHITDIYKRQNAIVPVIIFFTLSDYRQSKLEQYAIKQNVFMRTFVMQRYILVITSKNHA